MRKAAFHNLGCKVNAYETEAMQQMLEREGYEIVPFQEGADVYIINTCSVTNIADRKSRQMLHRARKLNPDAIVVAVGCYVQAAGQELQKDEAVDLVIGNNKKADLALILREFLNETRQKDYIIDISAAGDYEELAIDRIDSHTRAFLKVQDGCNQFCSYCIIPYTRGRVRSRSPKLVEQEVRALASRGYQEIVLTGIHLSSYGSDFSEEHGADLLGLIRRIHEIEGLSRIRLGSLEPRIITDEFVYGLSSLSKVCPHFHLSLQSGCDETLRRMNRRYSTKEYMACCERLRSIYSLPAITTDVIVGFPGETQDEFDVTRKFLEQVGFYEMHVFKYSRRRNTRAASMPDQVAETEKSRRSDALIKLEKEMSGRYRDQFLGKSVEVLLEEEVEEFGQKFYTGYTREYVQVLVPSGGRSGGSVAEGILRQFPEGENKSFDQGKFFLRK